MCRVISPISLDDQGIHIKISSCIRFIVTNCCEIKPQFISERLLITSKDIPDRHSKVFQYKLLM